MANGSRPPATLGRRPLVVHREPKGAIWQRLYQTRHPEPLGFARVRSRFSDPTGMTFGVVYLGSSLKVAFGEVILRDRGDGRQGAMVIPLAEIEAYTCARIEIAGELRLVDLTRDGPLKMGVPSDVVGARDQTHAQHWSAAFHDHPDGIDGVYYPSRLNEERNIALYERALTKVTVVSTPRLIELRNGLADIINDFALAIR